MEEEGFVFLASDAPVLAELEVLLPLGWRVSKQGVKNGLFIYDSTGAIRYMCYFKDEGSPASFDVLHESVWNSSRTSRSHSSDGAGRERPYVYIERSPISRVNPLNKQLSFTVKKTS